LVLSFGTRAIFQSFWGFEEAPGIPDAGALAVGRGKGGNHRECGDQYG